MDKLWLTISAAPAEAWVGLMGVLFGSLLTTYSVWLTNRSNRKHLKLQLEHEERLHQQRLSSERLEELYILVSHWVNKIFSNYLNLTLVMKGHTDYNQYLDSITNDKSSESYDFIRLEMIVGIYGEQIQTTYDAAIAAREKFNSVVAAHKSAYKRGESGELFLNPLTDAQNKFIIASDALKDCIAKAARNA